MKNQFYFTLVFLLGISTHLFGQDSFKYSIHLNQTTIEWLPGLHSYAFAQHDGHWLIIGGRKDGIHARQPFNAFPENMNNSTIYVVNPTTKQSWSAPLSSLPNSISEQLQSTNMNFIQNGDTLFIIGGYSYAPSAQDHITHPKLTSIIVSELINAIINQTPFSAYFQQLEDPIFANSGGQMGKLGEYYFLIGGHRFDGRYNPMGNATYTQEYKTMIQKFKLSNEAGNLNFSDYTSQEDPIHLRRRDYNLLPQIFPDGTLGYMISAGVFQINADLPFLYPVDITENGYTPRTEFNQFLSHYHGAKTSIYDEATNETHMLFYGGMSRYYYEEGNLIQDDQVPFVKTISRVTRNAQGELQEYLLPVEMPSFKGAGAEFIPNETIAYNEIEVLEINKVEEDSILIGYIYGGIQSEDKNPFANNQTDLTAADNSIFEVWLIRNDELDLTKIDGKNPFSLTLYPNPTDNKLTVSFEGGAISSVNYFITALDGKIVQEGELSPKSIAKGQEILKVNELISKQAYSLTLVINNRYYLHSKFVKE